MTLPNDKIPGTPREDPGFHLDWSGLIDRNVKPDLSLAEVSLGSVSVAECYQREVALLRHLVWTCYEVIPELIDACPDVNLSLLSAELRGELLGHILTRAEHFYPGR